jgi:YD repeat-containing protein
VADEQTATIDALNRPTTREYDAGGRLTVQHNPRRGADDLKYTYDALDRHTQLPAPHQPAPIKDTEIIDDLGQRTRLSDGTGTTSFSYDAVGHLTGVTAPGMAALSYGYDANGQRTSLRYPDNGVLDVHHDYDAANQVLGDLGPQGSVDVCCGFLGAGWSL